VIVGLREGEKMQEELWSSQESLLKTKMEGIKALNLVMNKQIPIDYEENPLTDKKAIVEINRFLMGSKVGM
jgi:FlaA1/EpsC-like NDP-sugar epimerase